MAWDIEATDEFKQWFAGLAEAEQISIGRKVDLLEMLGPVLGRSDVDSIKGSRFPNMKELRVQHGGKPYRVLFAFDPRQTGIPADWRAQGCERLVRESHRSCGWHL